MHQDFIQIFPISATKSQLNTNNNNWTNHNCLVQNFETIFIREITYRGLYLVRL